MKKLFLVSLVLAAALLIKCGNNSVDPNAQVPMPPVVVPGTPVVPGIPVVPQPLHWRGFKKPVTGGLHAGAPFVLADVQGNLPIKFNWIEAGFNIPVKNQGSCGSCYSFSSIENLEWSALIFLGIDKRLSTQEIVSCDNANFGCGGGNFSGDFEVANGIALESDFPYAGNNESCPNGLVSAVKPTSYMNIGDGTNSPTIVQLKEAIREYGPLSVDVAATASWDSYKGGVKTDCGGTQIDHLVVAYGWDDTQGPSGIWLVRNSWGGSYGINGDILLPFNCDSIATDAATVLVKATESYSNEVQKNKRVAN